MEKRKSSLIKMSYDRDSSETLSDYEVLAPISNVDNIAINKIARAWKILDCTSVKVATGNSGGGFYLSCGRTDRCSKDNFWFHIHILCDGTVILKDSKILENPEDQKNNYFLPSHSHRTSIQYMMDACSELKPFDANKLAALLYLWAGYNDTEACSMQEFIEGYKNFCDVNLFN